MTFVCNWEDNFTWWEKWEQTIHTLWECHEGCEKSTLFDLTSNNEDNKYPTEQPRYRQVPHTCAIGNVTISRGFARRGHNLDGFLFVPPGQGAGGGGYGAR